MIKKFAALTICSINYIGKALVLFDTYSKHHPGHDFYLLLVDRKIELQIDRVNLNIIWAEQLNLPDFLSHAFAYDVIEFNTNVKPTALQFLLSKYDAAIYLDPDIKVYSPLDSVFDELSKSSVVVTPHANTPVLDGNKPDDLELLKFGAFNLGFVGVRQCDEGYAFLNWWSARCLEHGYYEPQIGLAVDQKWVGLAPCFFPNLKILHDPGLNVAFWNLHERRLLKAGELWLVNGDVRLKFIHFSSFSVGIPGLVAQKQTRFPPGSRSDFTILAEEYEKDLIDAASEQYSSYKYGFDYFDDGTYITPALRRFYGGLRTTKFQLELNPFENEGAVKRFASRYSLLIPGNAKSKRHIFKDMGAYKSQIRVINVALRVALYVLGPERYFNLMRYLAHISSLRNQVDMFGK